jgi:hypothetical protein
LGTSRPVLSDSMFSIFTFCMVSVSCVVVGLLLL